MNGLTLETAQVKWFKVKIRKTNTLNYFTLPYTIFKFFEQPIIVIRLRKKVDNRIVEIKCYEFSIRFLKKLDIFNKSVSKFKKIDTEFTMFKKNGKYHLFGKNIDVKGKHVFYEFSRQDNTFVKTINEKHLRKPISIVHFIDSNSFKDFIFKNNQNLIIQATLRRGFRNVIASPPLSSARIKKIVTLDKTDPETSFKLDFSGYRNRKSPLDGSITRKNSLSSDILSKIDVFCNLSLGNGLYDLLEYYFSRPKNDDRFEQVFGRVKKDVIERKLKADIRKNCLSLRNTALSKLQSTTSYFQYESLIIKDFHYTRQHLGSFIGGVGLLAAKEYELRKSVVEISGKSILKVSININKINEYFKTIYKQVESDIVDEIKERKNNLKSFQDKNRSSIIDFVENANLYLTDYEEKQQEWKDCKLLSSNKVTFSASVIGVNYFGKIEKSDGSIVDKPLNLNRFKRYCRIVCPPEFRDNYKLKTAGNISKIEIDKGKGTTVCCVASLDHQLSFCSSNNSRLWFMFKADDALFKQVCQDEINEIKPKSSGELRISVMDKGLCNTLNENTGCAYTGMPRRFFQNKAKIEEWKKKKRIEYFPGYTPIHDCLHEGECTTIQFVETLIRDNIHDKNKVENYRKEFHSIGFKKIDLVIKLVSGKQKLKKEEDFKYFAEMLKIVGHDVKLIWKGIHNLYHIMDTNMITLAEEIKQYRAYLELDIWIKIRLPRTFYDFIIKEKISPLESSYIDCGNYNYYQYCQTNWTVQNDLWLLKYGLDTYNLQIQVVENFHKKNSDLKPRLYIGGRYVKSKEEDITKYSYIVIGDMEAVMDHQIKIMCLETHPKMDYQDSKQAKEELKQEFFTPNVKTKVLPLQNALERGTNQMKKPLTIKHFLTRPYASKRERKRKKEASNDSARPNKKRKETQGNSLNEIIS